MKQPLTLRDAEISDSFYIARLILETEDHPEYVWGNGTQEEILNRIEELVRNTDSRYSYLNIKVAEIQKKICGAIVLLPGESMEKLDKQTSLKLFSLIKGITNKLIYIKNCLFSLSLHECEDNELYIANLAIDKEYRGQGLGKKLMQLSEVVAKEKGYNICSLLAKDKHVKKYYENLDYIYTETQVYFSQSLYKMAKVV